MTSCTSENISIAAAENTIAVETNTVRIYALSRGRGVPEHTRKVYQRIKSLLQAANKKGALVQLQETRIGLEGETRICAEFRNRQDIENILKLIRPLTEGVDLLNIDTKKCN